MLGGDKKAVLIKKKKFSFCHHRDYKNLCLSIQEHSGCEIDADELMNALKGMLIVFPCV